VTLVLSTALSTVATSWKVLENIWEVSRASPGQKSKATVLSLIISTKS